ncbi:MAG: NAD+ synthase [Thaumarchaeota archaeon]|nr:NAD+ synthase [Nitrososphaerota archaeon]
MSSSRLTIDSSKEAARIISFVRQTVEGAGASGVVVGLSGGIDSAVVGAICVKALGSAKVLGLLMPSKHTPREDIEDGKTLAKIWGTDSRLIRISGLVENFERVAKSDGSRLAKANLQARLRMTLLYYFANSMGRLVAGTGDKSEETIGFFTKWGDGGVDFLPIAHLYKTQVRTLGSYLQLPERIVNKPASPQLWAGHRASDEIPVDYDKLDIILSSLIDEKRSRSEAASMAGVSVGVVERVLEMHRRSAHKRAMPPSLA